MNYWDLTGGLGGRLQSCTFGLEMLLMKDPATSVASIARTICGLGYAGPVSFFGVDIRLPPLPPTSQTDDFIF